jgi:SP family arabinose:H+ symporter-like MFS transporter
VVGSILSAVTAYFLAKYLPETLSWRWMFGAETIAVVLYALLLFLLPESPRWLMARGQEGEARDILARIDGPEHAHKEILEIKKSLVAEAGTFREFLQPGTRKALTVGVLLAIFAQTTGWSVLGGYLPDLFKKSGVSGDADAILRFVFAYVIMGVMTVVACVLVDRVGRKPLWIVGSAMMAVATGLMGMVYHSNITGWTVVAVASLCAIPHAFALGPLPWLMMSELYPTKIRAKAVATSTTVLWATVSFMVWIFPILSGYSERAFGSIAGAIWLFVLANCCSFVFGIKLLPETKGRTLENIAASFRPDPRGTGRL